MDAKKTRITLELTPWLERRLKAAADTRGMTMSQYCVEAIDNELARDEAEDFPKHGFKPGAIDRMVALRKEIFGARNCPEIRLNFSEKPGQCVRGIWTDGRVGE